MCKWIKVAYAKNCRCLFSKKSAGVTAGLAASMETMDGFQYSQSEEGKCCPTMFIRNSV